MKAGLRKIGNSRGIIFPKAILELCHFEDDVEMEVSDGTLVIRPALKQREGWRDAFRKVRKVDDDSALKKWQSVKNESAEDDRR